MTSGSNNGNIYTRGKVYCSRCQKYFERSEFGEDPAPICKNFSVRLRLRPRGREAKKRYFQYILWQTAGQLYTFTISPKKIDYISY